MLHFVSKQYGFFWYIRYNIETFVNDVVLKTNSYEKLCKKWKSRKKKFFISSHKKLKQQKRAIAIVIISKMRFIRAFAVSCCELRGLIFDIFVSNFVSNHSSLASKQYVVISCAFHLTLDVQNGRFEVLFWVCSFIKWCWDHNLIVN